MEILKNKKCLILSHVNQSYYDFHIDEFNQFFDKTINFNYMEYFNDCGLISLENEIANIIKEEKVTYVILWQWYTSYVPRLEFLQKLREKCFVVLWLFDDDIFFHSHGKFYAQVCDAVVTTDYFGKLMYEQLNIPSIYYLSAYDKDVYSKTIKEKDIDVSFVGGIDKGDRREYIEFLLSNGINIETYGPGSKNGYITFEEMVDVFNRSKINLNFTKIAFSKSIYEANPLINRIRQNKGRPVEIGLTHSFCLTEDAPSLKYLFDLNNDIDVFKNKYELLDKVKYYLLNEKKREEKADDLYDKCIKSYEKEIYFKRIFTQLSKINENKDYENINYYGIKRNNLFTIKEKAFYLRSSLVFLIKKRKIKLFFETIKIISKEKRYLIAQAILEVFRKYSIGESK